MDIADIRSTTDLPSPPKWAIEILLERHTRSTAKVQWDVLGQPTPVHKDGLLAHEQDWFEGRAYVKRQYGSVGRSVTLFNIGRIVAAQGYDGASIVATLGGRDRVLGYNKKTCGQSSPLPPETTALQGRKGELYALRKLFAQSIFRAGCDEDFTTPFGRWESRHSYGEP